MKKNHTYRPFSLLIPAFIWLFALPVLAQPVEKKINKTFNTTASTEISIDNTFGEVHIDTWDKNQIQAEITIKAESQKGNSQELMDRITIDIDESSSRISFQTEIESGRNWGNHNQKFEINYLVKMPKNNSLRLTNRHGDIYLDNFGGSLDLSLAHGQLVTEALTGNVKIDIEHGNGGRVLSANQGDLQLRHYHNLRIGTLGNMEVDIAHAGLELESAGNLNLQVQHSNIEIGEMKDLKLYIQHSEADLGNVGSITCDMQHSQLDIDQLASSISVDAAHSQVKVDKMNSGFKLIDLDGSHSYFAVGVPSSASAGIDVKLHHGGMKYDKEKVKMSYVSKEDQQAEYRGTMGSGSGQAKIKVSGSFTDFTLNTD